MGYKMISLLALLVAGVSALEVGESARINRNYKGAIFEIGGKVTGRNVFDQSYIVETVTYVKEDMKRGLVSNKCLIPLKPEEDTGCPACNTHKYGWPTRQTHVDFWQNTASYYKDMGNKLSNLKASLLAHRRCKLLRSVLIEGVYLEDDGIAYAYDEWDRPCGK